MITFFNFDIINVDNYIMIAFNLVATKDNSGSKTFVLNFLREIDKKKIEKKIVVFITKSYFNMIDQKINDNIVYKIKSNLVDNFFIRSIWLHFILPFELRILGIKTLFSSLNYCPVLIRLFNIRSVLFVHTVMHWEYPKLLPGSYLKNKIIRKLMEISIMLSEKVIVPSKYAKDKIVKKINIEPAKIKVVNLGSDHILKNENIKFKLKNFDYREQYILSVLSCVKYHNIINLLKAYKIFCDESLSNIKFVLVTKILDKKYYQQIIDEIKKNNLKERVVIFKDLDNGYLYNLYKNANTYIFSSYSEVFGFTTLEAREFNLPSLISDTSALREINGEFPNYFNPDDVDDISKKLLEINSNFNKNLQRINLKKDKKEYSWKKCLNDTLETIYE